jgi:hypothetical protein
MITQIANAQDALAALNENFEKLVKKERNPLMAKEVNNTIGKMTNVVKTQLAQKMWTGDRKPILWLSDSDTNKLTSEMKKLKAS